MTDILKEISELRKKADKFDELKESYDNLVSEVNGAIDDFTTRLKNSSYLKVGRLSFGMPKLRHSGNVNETTLKIFEAIKGASDLGISQLDISKKSDVGSTTSYPYIKKLLNMKVGICVIRKEGKKVYYGYDAKKLNPSEIPDFMKDVIVSDIVKKDEVGDMGAVDENTGEVIKDDE